VLVERTGTSSRTIERDIARLREAGVPIQVARGLGGGYRLDGSDHPEPILFTPGELAALVASLVAVGPYTSATAKSAFAKLIDALA
jgi:predicted DNA-binding transcriptional regulator YafY